MGVIYYRPSNGVDYGSVNTNGSGNILGDNKDGTYKGFISTSSAGTICVYQPFTQYPPAGRDMIAVRAGHRERQSGLRNGWTMTYLRVGGQRQTDIRAYRQDGSGGWRTKVSPPLYKKNFEAWTHSEISTMSTDSGVATGEFGPSRSRMWCQASEAFIQVIYEEPMIAPSSAGVSSATAQSGGKVRTASVGLQATMRAPQEEQPSQPVFEVARDSGFTEDVQEFVGPFTSSTSNTTVTRTSNPRNDTYTGLGSGVWHVRAKARDMRGKESGWGPPSSFEVDLPPIPAPSFSAGATITTPYGVRSARFMTPGLMPGDRAAGVTWQFATDTGFTENVVTWTNTQDAILDVGVDREFSTVSYDAEPRSDVEPDLDGGQVSVSDPSQYLTQGSWYVRVRATDVFGSSGPWSGGSTYTVSHPPTALEPRPRNGAPIDRETGVLSWSFGDPWESDRQSGGQVTLSQGSSTIVTHGAGSSTRLTPGAVVDLTPYNRQVVDYSITLQDLDGVSGQAVTGSMMISTSPRVTITSPEDGEQIITGSPVIEFERTLAAPSLSVTDVRVVVRKVGSNEVVYDSREVGEVPNPASATSYALNDRYPLENQTSFRVEVHVTDSEGLTGVVRSNLTTAFTRPPAVTGWADASRYEEDGHIVVHISHESRDDDFREWRIYRRRADGPGEWELAGVEPDPHAAEFLDWYVACSCAWEYSVVQVASRFGSPVESQRVPFLDAVTPVSSSYWLITPGEEERSVRLHHVISDSYTVEAERSEYVIIGGGRRSNRGTALGKAGSLTVTVRESAKMTASQQVRVLEDASARAHSMILRDPFGNLTRVSLGDLEVDRIPGVGAREFADITIPYTEVM